ncbi:MAG TPA: SCO family protein [Candidatus Baltobacteraceae bacterium]|nr:SCO family protein [Candidatus Baltobacteraceae bacterium]
MAILISLVLLSSANAANNSLTDEQLLQIKFDQKLNSQVSPALTFRDETGKQIQLGDYFGKRPTVLILGYYGCPMLCTLVLNGATESFRELRANVGEQFNVIFVSIDPTETPQLASEKRENYLREYGHRGSQNGWHFLTGDKTSIQTLADEVGFQFAYDPALKQFAHPSGFVILAPDGKVSHYFFGVTFSPKELDLALRDAGAKKIGSPIEQFILLCCEYSPLRGKYGNLVMGIVRVGGIGTVVALGIFFVRSNRRKSEVHK